MRDEDVLEKFEIYVYVYIDMNDLAKRNAILIHPHMAILRKR